MNNWSFSSYAPWYSNSSLIKKVVIFDGVITIGNNAFYGCTSLSTPESVTSIGSATFFGCESLTDVYYKVSEAKWNEMSISLDNEPLTNATIHFSISDSSEITYGDVSNDGAVDVSDVITTLQLLANGDLSGLTENQQTAADVNGDGNVDVSDVIRILQYLASPGTSLEPNK